MNKINVTYSRSSGPGGQNVNKLDTKVDLRFHVETAEWIPKEVRDRLFIRVKIICEWFFKLFFNPFSCKHFSIKTK